jgi:hypothetical protein
MTRLPALALFSSTAALSSRNARYCNRASIASASRSACGARIATTSSTASLRRLMMTAPPGIPASHACCASSILLADVVVAGEADDLRSFAAGIEPAIFVLVVQA